MLALLPLVCEGERGGGGGEGVMDTTSLMINTMPNVPQPPTPPSCTLSLPHTLTNCSSLVNPLTSITVYSGMSDTSVRQLRTAEVSNRAAMWRSTRSGRSVTDSGWSVCIGSHP